MAVASNDPKKYKTMENILIHINANVIAMQDKEKKRNTVILDVVSDPVTGNLLTHSSLSIDAIMARSLLVSGGRGPLCRTGIRLFANKLEQQCLAEDLVHQNLEEEEEETKNVSSAPAIRYNVCRERTATTVQKYQFPKSPQEDQGGSIKDVSAENVQPVIEFEQHVSKDPVHSPGYRQFQASSTYKNLVLPLKASKLSDPFPAPVKMMPSHTVSDQEKAQQMMAERRIPRSISKKKM